MRVTSCPASAMRPALAAIGRQISSLSAHVEGIASASRDQSSALQEVNGSIARESVTWASKVSPSA